MKRVLIILFLIIIPFYTWAQEGRIINGVVLNDADDTSLENVNIV
ncbi:MAG: carboxypeptidase-like regulatory domain-containing protein, partial [Bacteroidetes bacterium]